MSKNFITASFVEASPLHLMSGNSIRAGLETKVADPGRLQKKLLDLSWLAAAASKYNISPDLNDYQFAKVRSLTLELPNRNGHNFSFKFLTEFCIESGCQFYRTFEGKPILVNHVYKLETAIGVNVMTSIVQDGPYLVIENIIAVDRTKNPVAADKLAAGEAKFSMGANAPAFICSVCNETITTLEKCCVHTKGSAILRPFYDISLNEPERSEKAQLAYLDVINPYFIELSYLDGQDPADPRAWSVETKI
ncbi:hypothetical protein [Ewingella americana]|uniref:Uncharacterized protein n=1 Tax=Ewingella americana TaxID=41202 RepID=A0A502GCS7_9GAMM|nr:hypothetical protein [Ewingella americana]TPG60077.1 hypothetical protein EAH77_16040 [Ewingella americana]